MRKCTFCKKDKKLNEFHICKSYQPERRYHCKECANSLRRIRYQKNKEKEIKSVREWKRKHKECCKKYNKEWRKKYPDYHKKYLKEWRDENPISVKAHNHKRRSLTRTLKVKTVQLVYEDNIKKYGTLTCYLCLKPVGFKRDCLEHKIPLSKGGTNEYNNLAIAHRSCNSKKRDRILKIGEKLR